MHVLSCAPTRPTVGTASSMVLLLLPGGPGQCLKHNKGLIITEQMTLKPENEDALSELDTV